MDEQIDAGPAQALLVPKARFLISGPHLPLKN